ncbi:MAG: 4-phosphopantetheinyl transferase [Rhodocyclales bacterium]|nr:4-phosphopantetheinyl transferase [Rhodocyclales bacterium]
MKSTESLAACSNIARAARCMLPRGFAVACHAASAALEIPQRERALVAHAVPHRIAEFVGGRWCAHQVLAQLGRDDCELMPGALGGPSWPPGILGSITHEDSICLAVAGDRFDTLQGVGIDLLSNQRAAALVELADLFLSPAETRIHQQNAFSPQQLADFFCAKEATVKAVSHLAGRYLDLAAISIRQQHTEFSAIVADLSCTVRGSLSHLDKQILAVACC